MQDVRFAGLLKSNVKICIVRVVGLDEVGGYVVF